MAESREYPKRRWVRGWIVKDDGIAVNWNGVGNYIGYSHRAIGEVFMNKSDADFVLKEKRRICVAIGCDPQDIQIQPVMIPVNPKDGHGRQFKNLRALERQAEEGR